MNTAALTFTLDHRGRGGTLTVSDGEVDLVCPIELVEGGTFAVHLKGRTSRGRLSPTERAAIRDAIRRWLDGSERDSWTIEG